MYTDKERLGILIDIKIIYKYNWKQILTHSLDFSVLKMFFLSSDKLSTALFEFGVFPLAVDILLL